jgi:hypothetical protein
MLWHHRLGHLNFDDFHNITNRKSYLEFSPFVKYALKKKKQRNKFQNNVEDEMKESLILTFADLSKLSLLEELNTS